jgi:putative transposase
MADDPHVFSQESPQKHKKRTYPKCGLSRLPKCEDNGLWGAHRGYDGGKQIKGRKRFILTDSQGLLLAVWICAASVSEKKGAMQLLYYIKHNPHLRELCQRIKLVWVDGGYRGDDLLKYVKKLWNWTWQVVLRTDEQKGFVILPRRWVVERTFAWLLNARRLNKDYEKTRRNSQSIVYLAMLPILLNRLD